ncbi:ATP-binding protein [Lentzea sp. NPDC102401]|uniref:ATP-binding protein n=1 Tax=Lentzea sp. NPDC102401 TaxID=3364128 RepID=UPI003827216F
MLPTGQIDDVPMSLVQDLDDPALSIGSIRQWARDVVSDLDADALEDVVLVVNELVSNAFDHGLAPRHLKLHRSVDPCSVRVEVDDASPDAPVLGRSRLNDDRGRGLVIVDSLATDWGIEYQTGSKTVWAEINCAL